jgi:predicted glutamine amidotransferase
MCGIWGYSKLTDITWRMSPILALAMEERGKDSWSATNGVDTYKQLGPISDTFGQFWPSPEFAAWPRAIFHTRAASRGAVTIPNQHPFDYTHDDETGVFIRRVIGIHNGCINPHDELNKKYDRTCEVDSMHIFKHIAEGRDVGEIGGWGAIAWYEYTPDDPDGTLFLTRFNMTSLSVIQLETGEVVFASTGTSLVRAANIAGAKIKATYQIDDDKVFSVERDNEGNDYLLHVSERTLKFGVRANTTTTIYYGHGGNTITTYSETHSGGFRGAAEEWARAFHNTAENIYNVGEDKRKTHKCAGVSCSANVPSRKHSVLCTKCFDACIVQVYGKTQSNYIPIIA